MTSTIDIEAIELTRHAIERYQQRLRPGLSYEHAVADLARLLSHGELVDTAPPWCRTPDAGGRSLHFVIGDVALPLVPHELEPHVGVATTCLARNGIRRYRQRAAPVGTRTRAKPASSLTLPDATRKGVSV